MKISINDNGVGFNHTPESSSIGLNLIYSLSEQIDGQINIESKLEQGSSFVITFEIADQ